MSWFGPCLFNVLGGVRQWNRLVFGIKWLAADKFLIAVCHRGLVAQCNHVGNVSCLGSPLRIRIGATPHRLRLVLRIRICASWMHSSVTLRTVLERDQQAAQTTRLRSTGPECENA